MVAATQVDAPTTILVPRSDHVKLFVLKRFIAPASSAPSFPGPSPVPFDSLPAFGGTLIDENTAYAVIDVPLASAEGLTAALRPFARAVEERQDFDTLKFRSFPIDSTETQPSYPPEYSRTNALPSPVRDAFVLQFSAPVRSEWLDAIKAAGGTLIDYIPENGYTVLADRDRLQTAIAKLPVQLLRPHQPIHRIADEARGLSGSFADVNVLVLKVPEADDAIAWLSSNAVGGPFSDDDLGDRLILRRTIAIGALPQLAQFPAVTWIEPIAQGYPSGEREAHLTADDPSLAGIVGGKLTPLLADYKAYLTNQGLRPGYQALTVGMLDTGWNNGDGSTLPDLLSDTNTNLVTSVNYTNHTEPNNDCYGHGTMVAGEMAGNAGGPYSTTTKDSGGFYMGLGVAPGIHVVSGRIFNYITLPTPTPQPIAYDMILSPSGTFTRIFSLAASRS
jgi:hypothetical protein